MKLHHTKKHISNGIQLKKIICEGGFFSDTLYDYRTVYDLEEAAHLSQCGWFMKDEHSFMMNLLLNIYRDLKELKSK